MPSIQVTNNRSFPENHCLNNAQLKLYPASFYKRLTNELSLTVPLWGSASCNMKEGASKALSSFYVFWIDNNYRCSLWMSHFSGASQRCTIRHSTSRRALILHLFLPTQQKSAQRVKEECLKRIITAHTEQTHLQKACSIWCTMETGGECGWGGMWETALEPPMFGSTLRRCVNLEQLSFLSQPQYPCTMGIRGPIIKITVCARPMYVSPYFPDGSCLFHSNLCGLWVIDGCKITSSLYAI